MTPDHPDGTRLTVPIILVSISNVRLMILALVANFILVPAVAYGAANLLIDDADIGLRTGLVIVGAAAGAPFLPKLTEDSRIGIAPGAPFFVDAVPTDIAEAIARGIERADKAIDTEVASMGSGEAAGAGRVAASRDRILMTPASGSVGSD